MTKSQPNVYSQRWFECFHGDISDARTIPEVEFICTFGPMPKFRTVADVCCGMGRHARSLTRRGYSVTGIDRDPNMIARARSLGGGPRYIEAALRDYQPDTAAYDLIIVMGQSFGHFDAATNQAVLDRLATGLRVHGRLIVDSWNPDFFASHQGERDFYLRDGIAHEEKRIQGGRLFVHLIYPGGEQEDFEWQLFTRTEIATVAAPLGLTLISCCTDFDHSAEPCTSKPRIQFVFERSA